MVQVKKDSVIRVRLDNDLPDWVRSNAKKEHRSINAYFNLVLREYREAKERDNAKPA